MHSFGNFQSEVKRIEEWLQKEYQQLHTGRAAPALLDHVQVESYGSFMPIKNVSSIAIEDPRTLRVAPWDKNLIKEVERALHASQLGFSIAVDDQGIRVIVPQLTTERRAQLVKVAKERLEDARIQLRQIRENELARIKDGGLPEDALFKAKDDLQKLVDGGNGNLEKMFERKEEEILN